MTIADRLALLQRIVDIGRRQAGGFPWAEDEQRLRDYWAEIQADNRRRRRLRLAAHQTRPIPSGTDSSTDDRNG